MKILKIIAFVLLFSTIACSQNNKENPKKKVEQVKKEKSIDYLKGSNIIEYPEKLTGDEKAIFNHKFFQELTSDETRHLDPLKVKEEFAKLGITTKENDRFVDAYSFYKIKYWGHKKSSEQWEYFKDLAPEFQN